MKQCNNEVCFRLDFFRIKRNTKDFTKHDFLNMLSNKYGFNIELAHNFVKSDGTIGFSKWKSWLWLLEHEPHEYIKELNMTRNEFIDKATHRSILDIELVFDVDDKGDYNSILEHTRHICIELNAARIKPYVVYSTGSKGYHIHTFHARLRDLSPREREYYKKTLMNQLNTDCLKSSNRNMIAIEGEPHWKSGKIKEEVDIL